MSEKKPLDPDNQGLIKLSHFVEIGKAISRSNTIEETLEEVMHHIGDIFAPEYWSLLLKEPESDKLKFAVAIGDGSEKLIGRTLLLNEGIAGWIASHKEAVITDDVQNDSRFSKRVDNFTGFETKSIIGVPLISGETVFGVIELINKIDGQNFTPFELEVLIAIADFAAIAIEKAYFYRALQKLSTCDPLTGLHNKSSFDSFLNIELQLKERYNTPSSLLMINIDNFKILNDSWGHEAADKVLQSMAEILKQATREVDKPCRYGGDEFIVILPNTQEEQCKILVQRIIDMLDYENTLQKIPRYSITIAGHSLTSSDRSTVLGLLDAALHNEKLRKEQADLANVAMHLSDMLYEERSEIKK